MTIICWDGKTLAADRRACNGTMFRTTTKIYRANGCLVGFSGDLAFGLQMVEWIANGEAKVDFPSQQRDKDDWQPTLVIRPNGVIQKYERTPYAHTFLDRTFAIGSGRDFALMAMHLGKSALEAVELTCLFDSACGNGVDVLEFEA